ncbi:MAG: FAD-dependent oxidoreductase [Planctomycetaceae bacterium]|nr:FAD-dependent oxidoreductase [Planctomycetaceae bacterium]
MFRMLIVCVAVCVLNSSSTRSFPKGKDTSSVLVEAESFTHPGGWKLDTQFIREMGSPYMLAHGLGQPVKDANTTVTLPEAGTWRVFVRTKDWVARWNAKGQPGRFQVLIDGQALPETFGTRSAEWFWHDGGTFETTKTEIQIALHDLTGFDGRCDALYFTKSGEAPPNISEPLAAWRQTQLGLDKTPTKRDGYDLVVVGGGYAGMGAAISAARMGCKVALIQDRPVLGGNGSSEIRVWAMGNIRRGKFPRIGEIVEEFCDHATKSPGRYEEFEDEKKEAIVRAEKNIDLFLNHHAYQVKTSEKKIVSVTAFDTRTSEHSEFQGRLFCDSTGHGTIGYLADADWDMEDKGRMGMSNMWAWDEIDQTTQFPETPWALDLKMDDFPYPRDHHGQWFWESGFDKDAIGDAEGIRDHNLRAVYGAFNAMKNRDGADQHQTAILTWVAYIGGPRESRRLMGDVVLTNEDIVSKRDFPDGCVPSTWSIDLHYPKEQYADKFPDNPFISYAVHDRSVDRQYGYPVPYRCFYSRNIENLFMAGRNISVTHEALGTTRVMKTCGMMGEVVGRAASLCVLHECQPRDVYNRYLAELIDLLNLPGKAHRDTVYEPVKIPDDAMELASSTGPMPGLDPKKLPGLVIDDRQAEKTGPWTEGTGLRGFVAFGYLYSGNKESAIRYKFDAPATGKHEIRLGYLNHENRASNVKVRVTIGSMTVTREINMKEPAPLENNFISLGVFSAKEGDPCIVEINGMHVNGNMHVDAVQVLPAD